MVAIAISDSLPKGQPRYQSRARTKSERRRYFGSGLHPDQSYRDGPYGQDLISQEQASAEIESLGSNDGA